MLSVLVDYFFHKGLGMFPVTLKSYQYGYFIPDILKSLVVIGLGRKEYCPIWYVYDPASTLVCLHPVPDFQDGKLEQSNIDDIPGIFTIRSPTENGLRVLIKSQPAIFVKGSFRAMARPAVKRPRKAPNLAKADIQTLLIRTMLMSDRARPMDLFH